MRCSEQTEILETCLLRSLRTSKIFNPSAPALLSPARTGWGRIRIQIRRALYPLTHAKPFGLSLSKPRFPHPFGLRYRSLALDHSPGSSQSSGAALSPRRATHLFLLRQNKVSQKKATRSLGSFWGQSPNSPSLWLALRVRCFASQRNWCLTPITHLAVLGADGNFRNLSASQPSDI